MELYRSKVKWSFVYELQDETDNFDISLLPRTVWQGRQFDEFLS